MTAASIALRWSSAALQPRAQAQSVAVVQPEFSMSVSELCQPLLEGSSLPPTLRPASHASQAAAMST